MKRIKFTVILLILFVFHFGRTAAQQFFDGPVNTTSLITRTGPVSLGNVLFRNASNGIQVLEHDKTVGDFYIRSVAYNIANDEGNLILNDIGGFVGIGTAKPKEKLSVNGKIRAHEIKVETANWPDYVFAEGYQLPSLQETARYIEANKHLPGVPKAAEIEQNGLSLGEMNKILMQKIEELTLHMIDKDKRIEALEKKLNSCK